MLACLLDCTATDGAIVTVDYVDVEDSGHRRARIARGRRTLHSAALAPLSTSVPRDDRTHSLLLRRGLNRRSLGSASDGAEAERS